MINQNQNHSDNPRRIQILLGASAILIGAAILLGHSWGTPWLYLGAIPLIGAVFLVEGTLRQKKGWIIPGSLAVGIGIGLFFFFNGLPPQLIARRIGVLLVFFALGWCLISTASALTRTKVVWWPLIPAGIIASIGLCFFFSDLSLLSFVLYICLGLGLVLLGWGIFWKLFGLIIPGSLLVTMGPGIYVAWAMSVAANPLSKTGLMIAAFSFGWGLIVFFSRVITAKFIWWPLIPGGVLAMAGWGLYIGGDPGGAPEFIANTGSAGLIIFGLYLLLLRKSIHRP